MTTLDLLGIRIPAAGGGYLRQFPFGVIRRAFRNRQRQGQAGMFYIHPWEVDPDQPRIDCDRLTRIRHYRGLDRTLPRLERLLGEFRFASVLPVGGVVTVGPAVRRRAGGVGCLRPPAGGVDPLSPVRVAGGHGRRRSATRPSTSLPGTMAR